LVFLVSGVQQNFAFLEELYSSVARQVFKQLLKAITEAPWISLSAQNRWPFSSCF